LLDGGCKDSVEGVRAVDGTMTDLVHAMIHPMFERRLPTGLREGEASLFQREVDRLFNQFWSDLPARTAPVSAASSPSFQVNATDDG